MLFFISSRMSWFCLLWWDIFFYTLMLYFLSWTGDWCHYIWLVQLKSMYNISISFYICVFPFTKETGLLLRVIDCFKFVLKYYHGFHDHIMFDDFTTTDNLPVVFHLQMVVIYFFWNWKKAIQVNKQKHIHSLLHVRITGNLTNSMNTNL